MNHQSEDNDLLKQAQREADEIIAEAKEQARLLLQAAEKRKGSIDSTAADTRAAGEELARNLARSIEMLTNILEELRRQL